MREKTCSDCQHFYQHYVIDRQRATSINCGHCSRPRLKKRTPDAPACDYFEECTEQDLPNRIEVINYLTTDFLKEILEMSLPPEIEELP